MPGIVNDSGFFLFLVSGSYYCRRGGKWYVCLYIYIYHFPPRRIRFRFFRCQESIVGDLDVCFSACPSPQHGCYLRRAVACPCRFQNKCFLWHSVGLCISLWIKSYIWLLYSSIANCYGANSWILTVEQSVHNSQRTGSLPVTHPS